MLKAVHRRNLKTHCSRLAKEEPLFGVVLDKYGVPPLWDRPAGFATLLQIILEQQVSLASAKACFDKLQSAAGTVTPENVLSLNDTEMRDIGFSRQKAGYARHLADAVLERRIDLESLHKLADDDVRKELTKLKGIGTWTADIYLLMALLRPDVMPKGDIALHSAWQSLSGEPRPTSDEFAAIAVKWSPHRSSAARLLWHFYLSEKAAKSSGIRI